MTEENLQPEDTKHLKEDLLDKQMTEMIARIGTHLLSRGQNLGLKHDINDRLELGGVFFWLIRNPNNRSVRLGFTMNPKHWNYKALHTALIQDEHEMYIQMGAVTNY